MCMGRGVWEVWATLFLGGGGGGGDGGGGGAWPRLACNRTD